MKSIKQIRETYDLLTEKDDIEDQKLSSLVRAGLYDAKKLPALKRALDKNVDKMSPQEKRMISSLLDSLITQVINNDQVYRKVKQNVMMKEAANVRKPLNYSTMPSILVLKRKAIRTYPDGQNVGLYYSQQIDKYVAVPFGHPTDDEHVLSVTEEVSDEGENAAFAKRTVATREAKGRKREQNLKKAAKTAIRSISKAARKNGVKGGEERARKMGDFADKYHDTLKAMNQRQTGTPIKRTKQKPAQPVASRPTTTSAPTAPKTDTSGLKVRPKQKTTTTTTPTEKKPVPPVATKKPEKEKVGNFAYRLGRKHGTALRSRFKTSSVQSTPVMGEEVVEVNLNGNSYQLNKLIAKKVQTVYESLNKKNQKKMVNMMNESTESFNKVISFALRQ